VGEWQVNVIVENFWLISFNFPSQILASPSKQFLPLSFIIQLLETIPHEKWTGPNHPHNQKSWKEKIKNCTLDIIYLHAYCILAAINIHLF
jgi:hypothetical protein